MSGKVVSVVTFYFIVCNVACQSWVVQDDGCRTPNGGVGSCVPVKNCKTVVSFLKSAPKPVPSQVKEKLQEYVCGYQNGQTWVCCPDTPIPQIVNLMQSSNETNKVDVIKNHKNLKLLPTEECGYIGIPDKISNGINASLGEFPWMALLSYNTPNGRQFKCGGTVINDKYILTAAHCITELKEPLVSVRVGEYDISKKKDCETQPDNSIKCYKDSVQDLQIEKIIPHPNFNKNFQNSDGFNDIGLIRVTKMKSADNVEPVCLPTEEVSNSDISLVVISGWGFTEKKFNISSILQKVTIPTISRSDCQKAYQTINVSEKQMCANGQNQDTCSGDSGGPLQAAKFLNDETRMVQYGVISFGGAICGSGTYPGLYTRVDSYMEWILNNIEP